MRFVYFDEAGFSREPYAVVAGIMLHIDDQYRNLRRYILDMADDLVGKERPQDFVFHAKDLWHGEKFFPRDKWQKDRRLSILGHLADIPHKFDLPIIYACVDRSKYPPRNPADRKSRADIMIKWHLMCFMSCLSQTDRYMNEILEGEEAFIVVEDHPDHRRYLREVSKLLGNPRYENEIKNNPEIDWNPYTHLVDEPLFQGKSGISPLQIADICAFILSRHLAEDNHIKPFIDKIKPQLITGLRTEFVAHKESSRRG